LTIRLSLTYMRLALFSISLLVACSNTCLSTTVAIVNDSEITELRRLCHDAEHSICIRCARLSDLMLLKSLVKASKRGIHIRIITDTLTPGLKRVALAHSPYFIVHLTFASDRGRFFSQGNSYALFDSTIAWYGVKAWSPKSWRGKSTVIISSQRPNGFIEKNIFTQLWQRSQLVTLKF